MDIGKKGRWALLSTAGFVLLLLAIAFTVNRSKTFHHFLLTQIIQKAQDSTGARVEIGSMDLGWSPLTANFYGVTVHGREGNTGPPLLEAGHLRVSLGIRQLLKHEIDLYTVVLDHPKVHLRVSSDGRTNLPQMPAKTNAPTNTKLLVRHVTIRDGLMDYNDEQIPLSAELEDFHAQADFDVRTSMYKGSLGYGRGTVVAKDMNPFEHSAQIDFAVNGQGVVLDRFVLSSSGSQIAAHATLRDYAAPSLEGEYEGLIATSELARILKNSTLPVGKVSLRGRFQYASQTNQPFLRGLRVDGQLGSPGLIVLVGQTSLPVTSLRGNYELRDGNLHVKDVGAAFLDGNLSASLEIVGLDRDAASRMTGRLRGVSLAKISDALPASSRKNARVVGRANLETDARWSSGIQHLVARAHADLYGPLNPQVRADEIPVNGVVNVNYDAAHQSASFGRSQIRTANIELSVMGTLSRQSNLHVEADARDLHELSALVSEVIVASRPPNAPPAEEYDVRGAAHFTGQVSGSPSEPHISGQVLGPEVQIQGSKWRNIRVNLSLGSSGVELQNVSLETEQKGQIDLSARVGLDHWSFTQQSPMALRGRITKIPVDDVQRLAKINYPIKGELSGELWIEGSEERPKGQGALRLIKGSAWDEPIESLMMEFHGNEESVELNAHLQVAAGTIEGKMNYAPKAQRYDASVNARDLKLDQLGSLQKRAGSVSGILTATLRGQGTIKAPQFDASMNIPELRISGETISDVQAKLNVTHQHAEIELRSTVEHGYVEAKAGVDLTGQYAANAKVDVRELPLGPMLARYFPASSQDLRGKAEIHGALKGPLKDVTRVEAHAEIPTLQVGYKTLQLDNDGPLRVGYRNGSITIDEARLKGSGTDFSVQGVIPVRGTAPVNVSAKGNVDMALMQVVSPDTQASGRVDIDLRARGSASSPAMQGQVRIENVSLSAEALPTALSGVNGELSLSGNRIDVKQVSGSAGGGTISTHGAIVYGQQPSVNLDLQAKSVRVRPDGIRSVLDGNLQLNGTPQKSLLSGQVSVDRLSFQEGFDLATFLGQFSGEPEVKTPSAFESNMKLNVAVKSAHNLNPSSSQLSMEGSADLNVTGTAADPVILGRVALTRGEVFFLGKRFEVENGTVAFANPVHTEPVVNLYAKTVVEQYNITIHFAGPVQELKTTYTSEPSLPQLDIINLLAFGQTTAERASNAATPTTLGAESALAQGVAGQVAKGVQSATGISQLTIDPLAGNSQNPGAQVAIQQRVTGTILLSFSTDVTSTQRQTVELQYQPKRQVKVSVVRDEHGGYGIDVRLHKVF